MKKKIIALALLGTILSTNMPSYVQAENLNTQSEVTQIVDENKKEKVERTLWGVKVSPYVRKVIVTLEEKKVPYALKEILPTKLLVATKQEVPKDFSEISPLGKVPAYSEIRIEESSKKPESFATSDSSVIMEYLEQVEKDVSLRPNCPKANARVTWLSRYADDVIAPITHKVAVEVIVKPHVLKDKTDEVVVKKMIEEELPSVLDFLEKTLSDKRIWIADTKNLSLADIAIVSHLVTLQTANFDLNALIGENRPELQKYVKKVLERDSFKKALA